MRRLTTGLHLAYHRDVDDPELEIQYAVRMPDGRTIAYGDQSWVASGLALKDHPGGVIVRRTIQLSYGPWYPKQQDETPEQRLAEVEAVLNGGPDLWPEAAS